MAALVAATALAADAREIRAVASRDPVTGCAGPFRVGYRIVRFGTVTAAVWYPSGTAQRAHTYAPGVVGHVAPAGEPLARCGRFPLVVFSHGVGGCAIQSVFFTETLARRGYVVAAPEHRDALLCSLEGRGQAAAAPVSPPSVFDPASWSAASYAERRDDIRAILDAMPREAPWSGVVDADRIGIAGHSLGGYVALAMAGGWPEWHDPRLRAALLLSPYSLPLSMRGRLRAVRVPVMYQGADFDIGVTPFLEGPEGAYAQSNAPKYYAKLRGGHHFVWTNLQCAGTAHVAACLASRPEARLINDYGIGFLDQHLAGTPHRFLRLGNPALSDYRFEP